MAFLCAACSPSTPSAETESQDLATRFEAQAPVVKASGKSAASNQIVFAIDASLSMRGFAGCNKSPTAFSATLDHITTDLGISKVVRFGQASRNAAATFETLTLTRSIHCPEFYNRLQNPDYELYHKIAEDSTGATYLYLTDGVQSDVSGTNQSPSVAALKQWIADQHGLAIIAFTSNFSGEAWSEQRQKMIGNVTVTERPFYVFLFSREEAGIEATLSRFSPQTVANSQIIRFSPRGVECAVQLHKGVPSLRRKSQWAMVKLKSIKSSAFADYNCEISNSYPYEAIVPKISGEYSERTDHPFPPLGSLPTGTSFDASKPIITGSGSSVVILAKMQKSPTARYGYYQLRFAPTPGTLKEAIAKLSTDFDADQDSFNKTYRFSWLLEQLGRAQLATHPWAPFAFTLQYN